MKQLFLLPCLFLAMLSLQAQSPIIVRNINPGASSSSPTLMGAFKNKLIFAANNGTNGKELRISDGTTLGTNMLIDINTTVISTGLNDFLYADSNIFFFEGNDGVTGNELWKSDGTASGTELVKDINPGGSGSFGFFVDEMVKLGSKYIFLADEPVNGRELYITDGTAANTTILKNILAGNADSSPGDLFNFGNKVLFRAIGGRGSELYITDGTSIGTKELKDINVGVDHSYPSQFAQLGSEVIFAANTSTTGREVWKTDGTTAGTVLVKDIEAGVSSSSPTNFIPLGNKLLFKAKTATSGYELFITDGTPAGTLLLKDIYPGATDSDVWIKKDGLFNGKLYFRASTATNGSELWETDGTTLGTKMVIDINSGAGNSSPSNFLVANGLLYFTADDGTNGIEIFKTDGTASGTQMLAQVNPSIGSSDASQLTLVGNTIFFRATDGSTGEELWKIEVPTSIDEEKSKLGIHLYPNPSTSGKFKLQFDGTQANNALISVTDLSGSVVYQENLDRLPFLKQVELNTAAKGCYFVTIATDQGTVTKRLMVVD